jgi:long-subunit fatty acid transport protein
MRGTRRKLEWLAFAIIWSAAMLTGLDARADSTHYQTLQLGERSRGMAAAYTAFAADGAAIWYNPAGLPLLEPKLLQGSLSLVQRRTVAIEGALVTDGPDGPGGEEQVEDFQLSSNPTLPGFAVAAFAVGKHKPELDNAKAVQIAISAFQLYNSDLGGDINFQDELGRTNSLQFYQKDSMAYFAAGVGYRPIRKLSVGLTVLASRHHIEHVETASLAVGGTQDPTQGSPCPSSPTIPFCILNARQIARNTVFQMDAWYMSFRIGILGLVTKDWRLGLMFQPPGFRVGGKSTLRFELSDVYPITDPNNPGLSDSIFGDRTFSSRSPIPWELRLGVSYVISKKVVVAADLQLVGPVAGGSIAPGVPQIEGRANTSGILLADSTKRDFTWNISIGSEIQITKFLFTRFGFLTDNSSAPGTATAASNAISPAQIDRLGFSASVGGAKNGKGLSVGVSMLFGKGTGNGLDFRQEAFDNDTNFIRVPVKERIFIISIGGDIGETAGVVKTRVKEKRTEEQLEAEKAKEQQERQQDMEEETDPELKAAKARAIEVHREADEAAERAKEADEAVKELEQQKNAEEELDEADQEALQRGTKTGIKTIR